MPLPLCAIHIPALRCVVPMQASWRNVREALAGAGLGSGAGAPSLADLRLMAALCPGVVAVKEHLRCGLGGHPMQARLFTNRSCVCLCMIASPFACAS